MATLPLTEAYGGLGSYEALRNWLIRWGEDKQLAAGETQPSTLVGGHMTLGFGYDLATRKDKSRPYWILSDLASAGIELTITQLAGALFYVGQSRDDIERYLDDLAAHGTAVTPGDRRFVQKLSAVDRSDKGLFANLQGVTVSRAQGEALLSAGDAAAASLEIAFLSNKDPHATPGDDERDFERARTFLGGTLVPRTKVEAEAFLRAIAARSDAIARALANRQGLGKHEEKYRRDMQALVKASLAPFGIATTLTPQAGGSLEVGQEVPLERLAEAFGLSPLALPCAAAAASTEAVMTRSGPRGIEYVLA